MTNIEPFRPPMGSERRGRLLRDLDASTNEFFKLAPEGARNEYREDCTTLRHIATRINQFAIAAAAYAQNLNSGAMSRRLPSDLEAQLRLLLVEVFADEANLTAESAAILQAETELG